MMSTVERFVQAPFESVFEECTKDQLLKLAEHYKIEMADKKHLKTSLKLRVVKAGLLGEMGSHRGNWRLD